MQTVLSQQTCLHLSGQRVSPRFGGSKCAFSLRRAQTQCKVRAVASGTDKKTKPQNSAQAMEAAEKRWESQIREGRVKNVTCAAAGQMMKEGWTLLDVRPKSEHKKASVDGSVSVPVYVDEEDLSFGALVKQATALGMGGWWLGGGHMKPNPQFLSQVQQQVPKQGSKVIVACQKGLRSLAACEQLSRAGYQDVAWVNGGFDTARKEDLPVVSAPDLRYGGIGGLSEFLGWTEAQRQNSQSEGFIGGFQNVLKLAALVLLLDGLWFGYDQLQFWSHK
ncbi:hypothetical protein ABBQ32_004413 [Trebouxia sp. C0010 RCD-2024]